MTDPFDAAVASTLGGQSTDTAQAARVGYATALDTNPDAYAEAQRVARRTGVPVQTVFGASDAVKRQDAMGSIDFDALAKTSPTTAALLADVEKAKIAHDDVDNLTGLETMLRPVARGVRALSAGPTFDLSAGFYGTLETGAKLVAPLLDPLAGTILPENPLRRVAAGLEEWRKSQQAMADAVAGDQSGAGFVEQSVTSGVRSFGQQLPGMAATVLTDNPAFMLGSAGVLQGSQSATKALDAGKTPLQAALYGAQDATAEVATEMLPVGRLLKDLKAGAPFFKVLGHQIATEVPTELAATAWQNFNEWANLNPDRPFSDYLAELPAAEAQTVLATVTTTALTAGLGHGLHRVVQRGARREQAAQQADAGARTIEQINGLAAASKVLGRDPDTFEAFIRQAAEDGPVPQVFIDANALMQSGVADQVAAASPSVAAKLPAAAQTGGQIAIPTEEYAARIAPTEAAASLLDHLKTDPEGFSRAEAQAYMQTAAEDLRAEVERTLTEQQADDAHRQSAEAVRAEVKRQLDAAGRFTPQVNDAYSSLVGNWYAVTAAKLGITPEQLFEQRPLRVVAEDIAGGQVLSQNDRMDDENTVSSEQAPNPASDGTTGGASLITTEHPTLGLRVPVRVMADPAVRAPVYSIQNGQAVLRVPPVFASDKQFIRTQDSNGYAIDNLLWGLGDDVFVRTSENAKDYEHLKNGTHRGSKNHATGDEEGGLSVSRDPGHAAGKYAYFVKGRVIGQGSDGEPLLDMASVSVVSKRMTFSEAVNAIREARIRRERELGLAESQSRALRTARDLDFSRMNESSAPAGSGAYEQAARGSFSPETNTIALLKNADLSTFLHETGHFFLEAQADLAAQIARDAELYGPEKLTEGERQLVSDFDALLRWFGVSDRETWMRMSLDEKRAYHEQFARGFEAYLFEGKAPSFEIAKVFQTFRAWMIHVYKEILASIKASLTNPTNEDIGKALNVELTDEVRGVMDRMIASDEEIRTAEHGRGMMPLFASAEQAGRTPEEFAAYQALGAEATADAIQNLQTRGLRDMRWLHNARGREIRRLQKEAAARRAEVQMEARREVMSQPLYRAWQFLTGKLTTDDKLAPVERPKSDPDAVDTSIDSLFTAIAKLGGIQRESAAELWGINPEDKPQSGVFGKPVLRREGGLTVDQMAERLAELGYLEPDENGNTALRDFEDAFHAELGGSPVYSREADQGALRAGQMRPGDQVANPEALGAGRLDAAALADMALPQDVIDALKARRMTAANGLHPDIVAGLFGFSSGDELARKLAAAEPPRAEIDALTDLRMLERYGDLTSEQAIERAADAAIHNDARARFVATEANALAKAAGGRKVLASAAKEFARTMIARLKIRNIRPGQYAAAEARAAKASKNASDAGDIAAAAAEKRNQLVQNYAARAAYDAQDEVERGLRYLKKFDSNAVRKGLSADYTDQIDALLDRFDLRKGQSLKAIDKRASLAAWVESQREQGLEPDVPPELLNEAARKSYKDMTVEEFRGLVDTVKQIEHLGRMKNRLLTAADQRAYEAVRDEIAASIVQHAGNRSADTRTPTTNMGRAVQGLKRFWAAHIKAATWARILDGGRDGGPMWEYFVRSANARGDMETRMRADATARLSEILAPVFKLGRMGGSGQYFPSIDRSLNREARIAIALNWGNEGNRQRLLGGEGWTPAQVAPVLQSLTASEWSAVQAIWDHLESYRPQIAEKERRIYGKEPEWVEPSPFRVTTPDGNTVEMRGGYYPVKYDPAASQRAEEHADAESAKRQLQGAYTTATTRRSFTKSRVEEVSGRPLLYTLSGLYAGVNDVIHDLAWHEWLIDANRLLRSKTIDTAIRGHYGPEVKAQFKSWVQDVAEGEKGADAAVDMALSRLRQGVSAAGLGFNAVSAIMQPLGLTQSIVRVGAPWVGRGVAKYLAGPVSLTREINSRSTFMAERARTRFRELNELRNQVQDQNAFREITGRYAYFLMMRCQQAVDVPTWWGAYEKAIAEGNDETRAGALADQAVIDAQGGGQTKDLSAIERGGPAQKLFIVFYGFMNTALNVGVSQTMTADTPAKRGKLAADYLLLYVVPAVLGYALKQAITPGDSGDDEDWEALARKMAAAEIDYLMGLMAVVREFADAAKTVAGANDFGRDYTGPAGLRLVTDTGKLAQQAHQGEFDTAFRKALINVIGGLFGLPSAQINRTVTGAQALAEGKTENPAAVVFGFQERR